MNSEIILTSAVTAAVVSGMLMLLGKKLDHKQQNKVMLFDLAFRVAKERRELFMKISEGTGKVTRLRDDVFTAADYYKWIAYLFKNEKLPDDAVKIDLANQNKIKNET